MDSSSLTLLKTWPKRVTETIGGPTANVIHKVYKTPTR
jgi:hypothetical protein